MVASAYAYFNYQYSKYKFLDFDKQIFYSESDIFYPKKDEYLVFVFSSNMMDYEKIENYYKDTEILAVDLYQKRFKNNEKITYISGGMNTLLNFVQTFNIYEVPSLFYIKRFKSDKNIFQQDSIIQEIEIRP